MFGHYIFFLEHIQRCIFYSIAVIFSKWYRISLAADDGRIMGLQAKSVIPSWIFTKYQYSHFTLELLLLICTSLMGPMTYFYQNIRPGKLDQRLVDQWQLTIIIVDGVIFGGRVLFWLLQASLDDRAFLLICTLFIGITLLVLCKDYIEEYVDLSKI